MQRAFESKERPNCLKLEISTESLEEEMKYYDEARIHVADVYKVTRMM